MEKESKRLRVLIFLLIFMHDLGKIGFRFWAKNSLIEVGLIGVL